MGYSFYMEWGHFFSFSSQIVKKSQAGAGVAVKIEHAVYQSAKMFGRHFDEKDELLSHISRQSIDVLKVKFLVPDQITLIHRNL